VTISDLPAVNATLNAIASIFLVIGWVLIKQGRRDQHRVAMLCAFGASTLFLAGYLVYHYHIGSKPYEGQGPIRVFYFAILISHIILAAFTLPLAIITLSQGLRERWRQHRRIARWTLPIWLYTSVTGVMVYWMLYQM
jgi:putative membrane protein